MKMGKDSYLFKIDLATNLFFLSIIISSQIRLEPFIFAQNYLSDLGFLFIKNRLNLFGFIFFNLGLICLIISINYLGKICSRRSTDPINEKIQFLLRLAILSTMIMMFFPKDINYDLHQLFSIGIYSGLLPAIILINSIIKQQKPDSIIPLLIGFGILFLFGGYVFAEYLSLNRYIFQKLSIFSIVLSIPYYARKLIQ
jgi:hypothetical membrane protein